MLVNFVLIGLAIVVFPYIAGFVFSVCFYILFGVVTVLNKLLGFDS